MNDEVACKAADAGVPTASNIHGVNDVPANVAGLP